MGERAMLHRLWDKWSSIYVAPDGGKALCGAAVVNLASDRPIRFPGLVQVRTVGLLDVGRKSLLRLEAAQAGAGRYQGTYGAAAKALAATEVLMEQITPRSS
ncbi:hypothetical protein AXG93_673s1120 [Marchantia polymorpha subsp. ruderalis]|uniref:Uncharacterized protein n=1 Tax=Marchantia polymorpha subsp. ruderalis TaxID=1480154 RepID=A0A176WKQ6_MARPO|nr:hypothetical protein AXG93_673s1120 [Marchantia polymorpha subsp. ruderalis]